MIKKAAVKQDLLDQLDRKGVVGNQFLALVEDYMCLWDIKSALIKDIKKRGVSVEYNHGGGQSGWKKNDSISELMKTCTQMSKILSDLGIKAEDMSEEYEEEM